MSTRMLREIYVVNHQISPFKMNFLYLALHFRSYWRFFYFPPPPIPINLSERDLHRVRLIVSAFGNILTSMLTHTFSNKIKWKNSFHHQRFHIKCRFLHGWYEVSGGGMCKLGFMASHAIQIWLKTQFHLIHNANRIPIKI